MTDAPSEAAAEYARRLENATRQRELLQKIFNRIGNARLSLALVVILLVWLAWARHAFTPYLLLIPLFAFLGLVGWHQNVQRRRRFADRSVRFYQDGLKRIADEWPGTGATGLEYCPPEHIYAEDLDVFGQGSLFQLLSRARTGIGERTLAQWLLAPASADIVSLRQRAIQELAGNIQLREDIAVLAGEVGTRVHAESIGKWGTQQSIFPRYARPLALGLSIAGIATGLACVSGALPVFPFLLVFLMDVCFLVFFRKLLAAVAASLEAPAADLDLLSSVIARLEGEHFSTPALVSITKALQVNGVRASRRIARLRRYVEILDSSDNFFVRIINPVVLWRAQTVMAIERWRETNGAYLSKWLSAVGDFEALSSLACLGYERPSWSLPQLSAEGKPIFAARLVRHPLLPGSRAVANDVSLGRGKNLLIISGSNMSGKSTLLRAVGLNAVLAWAGAPVCAAELAISPLQVGASLRVSDSLQDNRSRFMAEILRLRNIVSLSKGPIPVLFLLDELLSGTNSHDRRIGAAALVRSLLASGAIGMLTTHDLALSAIADELGAQAANAHFQDTIVNGSVEFDYQLHAGVVTRSNALELMRAVGLPV